MAKKDFEKKAKRHASGIVLKAGAANKTNTSFKAKQLVLTSQSADRAHLINLTGKSHDRDGIVGNNLDMEAKEWRAMVRLACAHCGHHAPKARRDAWERLRRLLSSSHYSSTSLSMAGIHSLLLDTLIRAWYDDDEAVRKAVIEMTKRHLHVLLLASRHDGVGRKLECGLQVSLSHIRPECRLTGRAVLATLLSSEECSFFPLEEPFIWALMDNLLLHMRLLSFEDKEAVASKATDVSALMPKLLKRLLPSQDDTKERCPNLHYEWTPIQSRPLSIIRRTRPRQHGRNIQSFGHKEILLRFVSKLTLLWPLAEQHGRTRAYLMQVCRLLNRVCDKYALSGVVPDEGFALLLHQ